MVKQNKILAGAMNNGAYMKFFKDGYDLNDSAEDVRITSYFDKNNHALYGCRLCVIANGGFVWIDMNEEQLFDLKKSIHDYESSLYGELCEQS